MNVTFDHIGKRYGEVHAVRDLNLTVRAGALHFLLGPSGCGKTTTLRMLAGLEAPTSGRLMFGDRDVTRLPAAERGIGMVFQNYALWPHMSVRKNIEYGLKQRKLSGTALSDRVREALELAQLTKLAERMPGQLSGGQQQRVALARALAVHPNLLLLDEPLSNLDAQLRLEMRDNISRIHQKLKITTVYVTHDQKEALSMGTEISVMRDGRLVQSAPPRQLYHQPANAFVAGFVGETNLVPGTYQGEAGGTHAVDTGFGRLQAGRAAPGLARSMPAMVSVRPEALRLRFDPGASGSVGTSFAATVDQCTYLGECEQFQLRTTDGTLLKASLYNPPERPLNPGDPVFCQVDPADVLVLPRDGADT